MAIQVSRFSEFAEMFAEAEANAKDLTTAKTKIDELAASLEYERGITQQQHSRITELEADLMEVVRERDSFRAQYWDADTALNAARGDLDAAQSLLSESRAEVEALKQRIVSLEDRLSNAEANNHDLGKCNIGLVGTIDRIYAAIKTTPGWTDPNEPLSVPEVAPLPPTETPSTASSGATYTHSSQESPSPSEAPKEPQPVAETAPTELGTNAHPKDDWDDYSKTW